MVPVKLLHHPNNMNTSLQGKFYQSETVELEQWSGDDIDDSFGYGDEFIEAREEEDENTDSYRNRLVSMILEEYTWPENLDDQYKVLEKAALQGEHDICMLGGASELLEKQVHEASRSQKCPVCFHPFQSEVFRQKCIKRLTEKIDRKEAVQESSHILYLYSSIVNELNERRRKRSSNGKKSPGTFFARDFITSLQVQNLNSRALVAVKSGMLAELRSQKTECMNSRRCFACSRRFSSKEIGQYLSAMDRIASNMEERLHVHR